MSIVILAPNWLGDSIMALPAIRDIRRHFEGRALSVAARGSIAPVFRAVPGIDRVIVLERGKEVSQIDAEIGILLPNSFRSAWLLKRAGVKERWGYRADFRGPLLTRAVRRPGRKVSFPEYYSALVAGLGIETGPLHAGLDVPPTVRDRARRLLEDNGWSGGPLVGIAPGAAFGHAKRWLPARFAELSKRLSSVASVQCVVVGRSEDREAVADVHAIDLVGRTDLTMLMGVVGHCRAFVANDSGALHLAAALGVPAVGIYGPTDERYSRPITRSSELSDSVVTVSEHVFCRPCFMADCPIDHRCMKRVTTDRVYDVVRRFLEEDRS